MHRTRGTLPFSDAPVTSESATLKLAALAGQPEIFLSLQGEGLSSGVPSVFVRCSRCNLYCVWCDTDYTWNWQGTRFSHVNDRLPTYSKFSKREQSLTLPVRAAADAIRRFDCHNVVITGGEPLLQLAGLAALTRLLRSANTEYRFELETNGTLVPNELLDEHVTQYNVSPKLRSSGVSELHRTRAEALEFFAASDKAWFKFVATEAADVDEVALFIVTYGIRKERVMIMPEGTDSESLRARARDLVAPCLRAGLRLTDRQHVHLFGQRRGT